MEVAVIEFELTCPEHGAHRTIVPAKLPWPRACVHCFRPAQRREVRRFTVEWPPDSPVGGEAYIG
ncbi:MAG: hypothetical protein RMK15_08900 [Chloroflexota bacterium]|jgi:hypothetical protein|nr:hypothetical protein [Dehalococcoidia bacterium]MDW8047380.1 hypothetical protein [Chloroflexota bacterium]GBD24020.1 hypothetical protein HRbin29_01693 [bacterium HR29]